VFDIFTDGCQHRHSTACIDEISALSARNRFVQLTIDNTDEINFNFMGEISARTTRILTFYDHEVTLM
jgi:hypothetical protein